jgi:hypothetical protein
MSENLFRFLLRVYPSQFRKAYGDEAIQLFRDRSRDEKGAYATLRLGFDLVCDFAVTIPRVYLRPQPLLVGVPTQESLDGAFLLYSRKRIAQRWSAPVRTRLVGSCARYVLFFSSSVCKRRTRNPVCVHGAATTRELCSRTIFSSQSIGGQKRNWNCNYRKQDAGSGGTETCD